MESNEQVLAPAYQLADRGKLYGALTLISRFELVGGVEGHVGAKLLETGQVALQPREGYIDNVRVFDTMHSGKFVFMSKVHIDAIKILCGQESVDKLRNCRAIDASAWLLTGGDISRRDVGLGVKVCCKLMKQTI